MATVQHSDLTGANLHEPKGIEGASSGQVYIADGAGSGAWDTVSGGSGFALDFIITDGSDTTTEYKLAVPQNTTLTRVVTHMALNAADGDLQVFDGTTSTVIGLHTLTNATDVVDATAFSYAFATDSWIRFKMTDAASPAEIHVTAVFISS